VVAETANCDGVLPDVCETASQFPPPAVDILALQLSGLALLAIEICCGGGVPAASEEKASDVELKTKVVFTATVKVTFRVAEAAEDDDAVITAA